MRLYIGNTNFREVQLRLPGRYFCADPDPKRKIFMPGESPELLLDSGAFGDVRRGRRSFEAALDRQMDFELRSGVRAARLVSYDLLIDEQLDGAGHQIKKRWDETPGWTAVDVTIQAAEFLHLRRRDLAPRQLVLSCQGVTPDQYRVCAQEVLKFCRPGDCFGFGGWCIVGQRRELLGMFYEVLEDVLPMLAASAVLEAHVFGVAHVPALRKLAYECERHGILPSTDTTRFYGELTRGYRFNVYGDGRSIRVAKHSVMSVDAAVNNIMEAEEYISGITAGHHAQQRVLPF
jgi:hypothetical protein